MKKHSIVFLTCLMILIVSGCGKNELQGGKVNNISRAEMKDLDLSEKGTTKERSINDICVHPEPLVYRKKIFDESGELVWDTQYEYDESNRYKVVYTYRNDDTTSDMLLYTRDDYSYDEYFYYINTTYVQDDEYAKVTESTYDTHGNLILSKTFRTVDGEVITLSSTYTYEYPTDTDKIYEEYVYEKESLFFNSYTMRRFNEYGDEIYYMIRYNHSLNTKISEYNYDEYGRAISLHETHIDEDIGGEYILEYVSFYTYDDKGLLISEEMKYGDIEDPDTDTYMSKKKKYEYDDRDRLIRETTWYETEYERSALAEMKSTVEYFYEECS